MLLLSVSTSPVPRKPLQSDKDSTHVPVAGAKNLPEDKAAKPLTMEEEEARLRLSLLFFVMTAFVNTISFSHRFSDEKTTSDCCSYQEINHIYSGDNTTAMARAYVQFMLACGYAPSSVLNGMASVVDEYSEAWGYNEK